MRWIRWIDTLVAVFVVALVMAARLPVSSWAWAPTLNASANCGKVKCGTGFNGSYHDFVNGPGAGHYGYVLYSNGANLTVGQCTLCHTAHSALLTSLLWNHHLSNNTQFTWDINATMAGTPFATIANTWGGSTTKCLSCHDGSVSPSTINWYQGATPIPGTPSCVWNPVTNSWTCSHAPVAGLGGNMADTHPVAMPYPCGQARNAYDGVTTGTGFTSGEWVSQPPAPIEIYTQTGVASVSRQPQGGCIGTLNGIECGSCHDVHNGVGGAYDMDLIRGNINNAGGGYICEGACHNK